MWTLLRKLIHFLFSKTTIIFVVCFVVVSAVALWLFAQHHLEQRQAELDAAKKQLDSSSAKLALVQQQADQFSSQQHTLQQAQTHWQQQLILQGAEFSRRIEEERYRVTELGVQLNQFDKEISELSSRLAELLQPFENSSLTPNFIRRRVAVWRTQLEEKQITRNRLQRRISSAQSAANSFSQQRLEFMEKAQAEIHTATNQLQQIEEKEQQHQLPLTQAEQNHAQASKNHTEAQANFHFIQSIIQQSKYWFQRSWDQVKWYLIGTILLWLFGPLILRTLAYFLWAPLLELAPAIQLTKQQGSLLCVSKSAPAKKIWLQQNEVAVVHEHFLQSSDEPLQRRTQWLWNWRYPFTSVATGMMLMTRLTRSSKITTNTQSKQNLVTSKEISKSATQEANHSSIPAKTTESSKLSESTELTPEHLTTCAQNNQNCAQITLSSETDHALELAVVELKEGGQMVCRPRFIVGLLYEKQNRPKVKSRWVFGNLHAWITFQFRYFVFQGPCKLVLTAGRGIQIEDVDQQSRRINEDLTIAFEPWLHFQSRRCETFMAYLRNKNPLFDDQFHGSGRFLAQQIRSNALEGESKRSFWKSFFGLIFKALGL